jgi:hypothetical protein
MPQKNTNRQRFFIIVENIEKPIASLNKSYQNIVASPKLKE